MNREDTPKHTTSSTTLRVEQLTKAELLQVLRNHGVQPSQRELAMILHERYWAQAEDAWAHNRADWKRHEHTTPGTHAHITTYLEYCESFNTYERLCERAMKMLEIGHGRVKIGGSRSKNVPQSSLEEIGGQQEDWGTKNQD